MCKKVIKAVPDLILLIVPLLLCIGCIEKIDEEKESVKKEALQGRYVFSTQSMAQYKFPSHKSDLIIDRSHSVHSEVLFIEVEPGRESVLNKYDDSEQISYVTEGIGTVIIGEEKDEFVIRTGDVVKIPVSTSSSVKAAKNSSLKYLYVDCFGIKSFTEPAWDDHVRSLCKKNG